MTRCLILVLIMVCIATAAVADYPRAGIVVDIDESENILTVEDPVGFIWEYGEIYDLSIGDVVIMMLVDENGTESIIDDIITSVEYSGYVSAEVY